MRATINKPIAAEQLLETARAIYSRGWSTIKLYFMIGQPGETLEDVQAIADLCKDVLIEGRKIIGKKANLHAGISTFVPKPHTPFQWAHLDPLPAVLEKQNLLQVEKENTWKDWQKRFSELEGLGSDFNSQLSLLEETHRSVKNSQQEFEEINDRFNRRINEITEMQRLGEERLRQEWVTFKAEDQKRWTGYTLSSEENIRDVRKTVDKYEERITAIDDASQTLQDLMHQTTDATEQQLQELMNIFHQWLTAYERIMGHARKTPK